MCKKKKYLWFLMIFSVSIIIVVAVSQQHTIKAVYEAFTLSEEALAAKKEESQVEVNKALEHYQINQTRSLTNEELQQLIVGELSVELLTDKITQENFDEITEDSTLQASNIPSSDDIEEMVPTVHSTNSLVKDYTDSSITSTKSNQIDTNFEEREIVNYYTTQMYILQAKYMGLLETLKDRGVAILTSIPSEERTLTNLTNAGINLIQEASTLEKKCDQEVTQLLSNLYSELNHLGKDTSIVDIMQRAYDSEKVTKKAYYISLAKSML